MDYLCDLMASIFGLLNVAKLGGIVKGSPEVSNLGRRAHHVELVL